MFRLIPLSCWTVANVFSVIYHEAADTLYTSSVNPAYGEVGMFALSQLYFKQP